MKTKKFFAWALSVAMLGSSYVTTRVMADDTNLIKYGTCEEVTNAGLKGWWGYPGWIGQSQDKLSAQFPDGYGVYRISGGHSGNYSATWWDKNYNGLNTTVNVEKNTNYELSFWYKSNTDGNPWVELSVVDAANLIDYTKSENDRLIPTKTLLEPRSYKAPGAWSKIVAEFNSGDSEIIAIELLNVNGGDATVLFDDFSLIQKEPSANLIKNPNCDYYVNRDDGGWMGIKHWFGYPGWEGQSGLVETGYGTVPVIETDGNMSVSYSGNGFLGQVITVEPGKQYKLSFRYKINPNAAVENPQVRVSVLDGSKRVDPALIGTDPESESARIVLTECLTKSRTTDTAKPGITLTAGENWTETELLFNSGKYTKAAIDLWNLSSVAQAVVFDDFSVIEQDGINLISNPGFEEGKHDGESAYDWFGHLGWIGGSNYSEIGLGVPCVVGGHSGNYSASWDDWGVKNVITTAAVNKNTDYELKFWYKSNVSGSQPRVELSAVDAVYLLDTSLSEPDRMKASTELMKGEILNAPAEWTEVTRIISTGNAVNIAIKLMNVDNGSKTVLFDDFSLVEKGATPPKVGVIVNSDFSDGLTSWNIVNQSTTVESVSAENGAARIEIKDTDEGGSEYEAAANYAGINQRVPVAANTDYTLTYRYKNDIAGHRFSVYNENFDGTDDAGERISTSLLNNNADPDNWKTATYNFNSGANEYVTIEIETNTKQKALFYADDFKMTSGDLITSDWKTAGGWNYAGGALSFKNGYQYTSAYQEIAVEPNTTYRISYEYTANGHIVSKIDEIDWINIGNETNGSGVQTKNVTTKPNQTVLKVVFMSASATGSGEFTVKNISVTKVCEDLTARAATADIESNQAVVSFALSNSKAPVRADVYVALYGENDKLLGVCGETDVAISGSYVLSKTITLPSNAEVKSGKAFIWSAEYDENMKPLMGTYIVEISK